MSDEYDLQANGNNGVRDETRVGSLADFNGDALWFVDTTTGAEPDVAGIAVRANAAHGVDGSSDTAGVTGAGGLRGVHGVGRNRFDIPRDTTGVLGEGYSRAAGVTGVSFATDERDVLSEAPGVMGASEGAGVVGLSLQRLPHLIEGPEPLPLPDPSERPDGNGVGVVGKSGTGIGVLGESESVGVRGLDDGAATVGVHGTGGLRGVVGDSTTAIGVEGSSLTNIGVYGQAGSVRRGVNGLAGGFFVGGVIVVGPLTVFGAKSAAVEHTDGTHRLLYAVESPESWFEDFGEARLVDGVADVPLPDDFGAVISVRDYHVFLTPYAETSGLYVAGRDGSGFQVREQAGGTGDAGFAYRIVGRRRDLQGERMPATPAPADMVERDF